MSDTPAPSNVTVLLVDDQAIIGESVRRVVAEASDIQFHFCQRPTEALALAAKIHPTVILQDLVMPEMNGLDLVRYFRAAPTTRQVPLIVLSSREDPEVKAEAFALGANDYLVKLPDSLEMLARIRYHSRAYTHMLERNQAFAQLERQNQDIAEKNHALEQLNQEKNEFLGIAAHDLKNPLSAVKGLAEMVEEDCADMEVEEIRESAEKIRVAAAKMFNLITTLLDVNAIESGKMNVTLAATDLLPLVSTVVEDYRLRAEQKQITLHFHAPDAPVMAIADENTVQQILDNLVSNAVKYSPPGKSVLVSLYPKNGQIRCSISDQGPGLNDEDKKKLFGKFNRLSAKPTAGEHSTGLGLFIVKKLAEAMRGDVWCDSEPGRGATFTIALPVAEPEGN